MSHKRYCENRKRLKRLSIETENSCCAGAYFDESKGRYVKYTPNRGSGYTKYLKKMSNKKLRQTKETLNHRAYKKNYDYMWILF